MMKVGSLSFSNEAIINKHNEKEQSKIAGEKVNLCLLNPTNENAIEKLPKHNLQVNYIKTDKIKRNTEEYPPNSKFSKFEIDQNSYNEKEISSDFEENELNDKKYDPHEVKEIIKYLEDKLSILLMKHQKNYESESELKSRLNLELTRIFAKYYSKSYYNNDNLMQALRSTNLFKEFPFESMNYEILDKLINELLTNLNQLYQTTNPNEEDKIKFETSVQKDINIQKENLRKSPKIEPIKNKNILYRVLSKGKDPSPNFKSYMFSEDLFKKNNQNFYYTTNSDYIAKDSRKSIRNNTIYDGQDKKKLENSSRSFYENKSKSSAGKNEHIKVDWNNYTSKFHSPHKFGEDIIVKKYSKLVSESQKYNEQSSDQCNSFNGNFTFQSENSLHKRSKKESKIYLEFDNIDKEAYIKLKRFFDNLDLNYNNEIPKNESIYSGLLLSEYKLIRNYFNVGDRDNFCKSLKEAASKNQESFTFLEFIRFLFDFKISNSSNINNNGLNDSKISLTEFLDDKISKIKRIPKHKEERIVYRYNQASSNRIKNYQRENPSIIKNQNKSYQEKNRVSNKKIANAFSLNFRSENELFAKIDLSKTDIIEEEKLEVSKGTKYNFHALEVPLDCKIPKFDEIMRAEEERRKNVKENSAKMTIENQRPFSFYSRDKEFIKRKRNRITMAQEKIFGEKFKAKPSPKTCKITYKSFMERENSLRKERIEANKIKLLQDCSPPENMQNNLQHQIEKKKKLFENFLNERNKKFTFAPQVCSYVPDFKRLHKEFKDELEKRKSNSSKKSPISSKSFKIEKNDSAQARDINDNKMKERYNSNQRTTSKESSKITERPKSAVPKSKNNISKNNQRKSISKEKKGNFERNKTNATILSSREIKEEAVEKNKEIKKRIQKTVNNYKKKQIILNEERIKNQKKFGEKSIEYKSFLKDMSERVEKRPLLIDLDYSRKYLYEHKEEIIKKVLTKIKSTNLNTKKE